MDASSGRVCSGYCIPLYLYGGIATLGLGANFIFDRKTSLPGRFWALLKSLLWAILYGLLIFIMCRSCLNQYAYIALVLPSLWFGINMFLLMLQQRSAKGETTEK